MLAEARVAIVGGGVAGTSLLYHLGLAGWEDVVLLEENELTSGSTWHAAGLCTQFNPSYNLTGLLRYSVELYKTLAADYHECGSVRLATTPDRVDEFRHRAATAELLGVPVEIVGPERVRELHPLIEVDDVLAAAYLPTDGHVDPSSLTRAFVADAGDRVFRHAPVTALERRDGAWTLTTPKGEVRAAVVVDAAGQWAPKVARLAGADLPLVSLEHHYVVTDAIAELGGRERELPVLRDPDGSFYVRQEGAGLLVGPFERDTRPWEVEDGFHARLLPPDLDRLERALTDAAARMPAFGTAGIKNVVNGPDAYTPDGRCLMGPVPGLRDFHVLAGFSIFGIVFAGGAGRYAAEWIVDGRPSDNMWELDVRRFGDWARSPSFLVPRALDVYEREYAIHYPEEERDAGRPVKQDALHDVLRGRGAVMGFRFGWERPLWFSRDGARDEYSMRRGNWHDAVGEECRAVRSGGRRARPDELRQVPRLGPRRGGVPRPPLREPAAGARPDRADADVQAGRRDRVRPHRHAGRAGALLLVSAAATELHDYAWLEWHLPGDGSVELRNDTERYGVLTLAGPRSRELLQSLVEEDVSREAFPFFRARHLEVGGVPTLTLRVSYVGELGFELHHPAEHLRTLYDRLLEAGEPLGLVDFGYRALDSLRLEKAYRLWGVDMSADWTPLEAGLERFVAFDKGEFVGRDALLRQREEGVARTLACLTVETDDADPHGNEPVRADGTPIGYVSAGGYGHVVEQSIALAYLPVAHAEPETRLTVDILGEPRPAVVVPQPIYDPENLRLLS